MRKELWEILPGGSDFLSFLFLQSSHTKVDRLMTKTDTTNTRKPEERTVSKSSDTGITST